MCAIFICSPMAVKAEPTEVEQPLKIDSFVLNSNENERINATLKTSAAFEISFEYRIAVITDISQNGAEVAHGRGTTGEDTIIDIDMSGINTFDNYRFKITVTYYVEDQKYIANSYSQIFEYTQESYAEDLGGRNITVDALARILKIDWSRYDSYWAQSVLVTIDVDGERVVEDVIPAGEGGYDYYYDEKTKQITVQLKQVLDGKLSKGLTDTIDIVKPSDTKDFYIAMPEPNKQYDSIWNIHYYNGEATKLNYKTDSNGGEYEFNGDGSFLLEMNDDNEKLFITYTDGKNVKWEYDFITTIVDYAPTIKLLEEYNGTTVEGGSITIVGKVDDTNATVKVDGEEVKVDKMGSFSKTVNLDVGRNAIDIEATSIIGKSSRTSITVYKAGADNIVEDTSFFSEYSTLLISLSVSILMLVVLIVIVKKGGKKNEKEA